MSIAALSSVLDSVNALAGAVVDGINTPLKDAPSSVVLLVHALLMALLALAAYAVLSNQPRIKRTKNRMLARLLEIRILGDDPLAVFGAFGRVLWTLTVYLSASLKPMLFLFPVVILWIAQLAGWFEWRPLAPGESALVSAKLKTGTSLTAAEPSIQVPAAFAVDTPPFRSLAFGEVAWRIRAVSPGGGAMVCNVAGEALEKQIASSAVLAKVSPTRTANVADSILAPWERILGKDSAVAEIRIDYPTRITTIFGLRINWLVLLCIAAIAFGFALKKPFGVDF